MLALVVIAVGVTTADGARVCEAPRITCDASVPETWRAELAQLCETFTNATEIDRTARLEVSFDGSELRIRAQTADGRRGARRVRRPEMLHDMLEALLALPLAAPELLEPAAAPPQPPAPAETPTPRHQIAPRLGLGVSVRGTQGGRFSIGPAAIAAVYVDDWLIGTSLRWDAIANDAKNKLVGYEVSAVAFGLTVGRRLHHGAVDVDLAFEPRLVAESQSNSEGSTENGVTVTDFWFGGLCRVTLGHGSTRPYLQLDGDFAPSRLRATIKGADIYAPLPTWGAALTLGASWAIE